MHSSNGAQGRDQTQSALLVARGMAQHRETAFQAKAACCTMCLLHHVVCVAARTKSITAHPALPRLLRVAGAAAASKCDCCCCKQTPRCSSSCHSHLLQVYDLDGNLGAGLVVNPEAAEEDEAAVGTGRQWQGGAGWARGYLHWTLQLQGPPERKVCAQTRLPQPLRLSTNHCSIATLYEGLCTCCVSSSMLQAATPGVAACAAHTHPRYTSP